MEKDLSQAIQKLVDDIKEDIEARLPQAAEMLEGRVRELCDRPGSNDSHSVPGQPPFRQTGNLINNLYAEVHDNTITVGSRAKYARYVLSTRPALELAFKEAEKEIVDILIKGKN